MLVRDTGFESTQAAVPLRFSPTMASCMTMVTAIALNIVMTPNSEKTDRSSGASPQTTAASEPLITAVQIKDWIHQVLVRHQDPKAAPIRLDTPLRHPFSVTRWSPATPSLLIAVDPFHKTDKDAFEIGRVLLELLHHERFVGEKHTLHQRLCDLSV